VTALRTRLRSPLRWLSAVMSGLMLLAIGSITAFPWLFLLVPVIAGLFLLAPPLGIYKHDETPVQHTGVRLEAYEVTSSHSLTDMRFRLVLVNPGAVPAEDFRLRLLLPHTLVPPDVRTRPLAGIRVGTFGTHWFIDTMVDATAITFRTAPRGAGDALVCPAGSRQELADLVLPAQRRPFAITLDYQVSGGTVKPSLDRLHLGPAPTREHNDERQH
jgi:hypothetical protein